MNLCALGVLCGRNLTTELTEITEKEKKMNLCGLGVLCGHNLTTEFTEITEKEKKLNLCALGELGGETHFVIRAGFCYFERRRTHIIPPSFTLSEIGPFSGLQCFILTSASVTHLST